MSSQDFAYEAFTLSGCTSLYILLSLLTLIHGPSTPDLSGLGFLPFRSPLLGESLLFSFPPGT